MSEIPPSAVDLANIDPRTPVIVGVGQSIDFWNGADAAAAPSPLSLARRASQVALDDTGRADAVRAAVDRVVVTRTMLDSVPGVAQPFGRCANLPGTLAAQLGITEARAIYSVTGGDQPQAQVNESAEAIHAGESTAVLLAGAEATAAMKTALRQGVQLDWSHSVEDVQEDRGYGERLLSRYEIANGFGFPPQTYPAFEHALRARLGLTRDAYLRLASELWSGFSEVAARHPFAQFPVARSADFLATPSSENYPVADPYLKWHVAQDAVNQGAAVIMTSVGKAAELGIDPATMIYLHGYAQAAGGFVTQRADLSRSLAIELSLKHALAAARITIDAVAHLDLYSCFPCAVLLAAEALGLDPRARALTVTGGLPFFGGAGNNYSMHAIATMVERLRAHPDDFGLVLANGGFLSKEAVGIYSARPKRDWQPVSSATLQRQIDAKPAPILIERDCDAVVETYTVLWKSGIPVGGWVLARDGDARVLARVAPDNTTLLSSLSTDDPLGSTIRIVRDGAVNVAMAIA